MRISSRVSTKQSRKNASDDRKSRRRSRLPKEYDPDDDERFDVNLSVDYCHDFVDNSLQAAYRSNMTAHLRENFDSQSEALEFVFKKYRERIDDIRRDVAQYLMSEHPVNFANIADVPLPVMMKYISDNPEQLRSRGAKLSNATAYLMSDLVAVGAAFPE